MIKLWQYIVFFVVCFLVTLILNLPLNKAIAWVQIPNNIRLSNLDGTLGKGSLQSLSVNKISINEIKYDSNLVCLLILNLCYDIEFEHGSFSMSYSLLSGDGEVSDVDINQPISELTKQLPNLLVQPIGGLEVKMETVVFVSSKIADMSGNIIWRKLGFDDGNSEINLGDFQFDVKKEAGKDSFRIDIRDLNAKLKVNGTGVINEQGNYNLDVKIKSPLKIDSSVKSILGLIAKSTGHNKYRIKKSGTIPINF